jgi:prephenate dehydrogenase
MYKIGIIGYGYVGKSMHRFFESSVVAVKDPYVTKSDLLMNKDLIELNKDKAFADLDLIVVSVPTIETKSGEADVTILDKTMIWLTKVAYQNEKTPLV